MEMIRYLTFSIVRILYFNEFLVIFIYIFQLISNFICIIIILVSHYSVNEFQNVLCNTRNVGTLETLC